MSLKALFATTRPSFLALSPICIFLGVSTALASGAEPSLVTGLLIFSAAISAHVSVNTLNEYYDFKSGLDLNTQRTPFSGGSGALPANPEVSRSTFVLGVLSLLLTFFIGVYIVIAQGVQVLPIGLLGLALVVTYTQWINRWPLVCLIAPGLGFGVLMVLGSHVVLAGEYSWFSLLVSLVPFFLVNNLLLLNQYPDIAPDMEVGRKTFPIVFGVTLSNGVFAVFLLAAYTIIIRLVVTGHIPMLGLAACLPMPLALFALFGAHKYASAIGSHPQYLAANVAAALLTPLLLALSIVIN